MGSVRFAKNVSAKKFAELRFLTHCTFICIHYQMLNHDLPNDNFAEQPRRVRVRLGNRFKGPPGLGYGKGAPKGVRLG